MKQTLGYVDWVSLLNPLTRQIMLHTATFDTGWFDSSLRHNEYSIDITYLDFKKAFDTVPVPQQNLLQKLTSLGIHGNVLKWIESFLSNRSKLYLMAINLVPFWLLVVSKCKPLYFGPAHHNGPYYLNGILILTLLHCTVSLAFILMIRPAPIMPT